MFAGHVGAALALGRVERRVNVDWLVLAAMWLDAVLWCFVLLGWEAVTIPANFASTHQPAFVPLAGAQSAKAGLALWNTLPLALALEALLALAGCWLFLSGAGLPRGRTIGLAALSALVLVSTVFGMTLAPPPPSAQAMAATSLATIAWVSGLAGWLARRGRIAGPAAVP